MSNDTQVKQEDVAEAVRIVRYCQRSDLPFVQRQGFVEDALATVRRDAFKEAQGMMDAPAAGTMASTEFHKGFESMRRLAKQVLDRAALEASASDKGEMNG